MKLKFMICFMSVFVSPIAGAESYPQEFVNMVKQVLKPQPKITVGPWYPLRLPPIPPMRGKTESDKPLPNSLPSMALLHAPDDPFANTSVVFLTPSTASGGELKLGFEGTVFMGLIDDVRDLRSTVANYQAQLEAQKSSADVYSDLFDRTAQMFTEHAVSEEEYEQARMSRDYAIAQVSLLQKAIEAFQARLDLKRYKASILKAGVPADIDKLYALYASEWRAQCVGTKAALEATEARLRLDEFVARAAEQAYDADQAESYFEYIQRKNDYIAARADNGAKSNLDSICEQDMPTLEEVKAIAAPAPAPH